MDFGVMFFSSTDQECDPDKYHLVKSAARYADAHGFTCVWTPERHFHEFGGLFPNPAITSAALATITSNLQLRAGSLITPLHDPIRVAEEWAMVDNFSGGRVAVSFGCGWNVNDFVFFPDHYETRQDVVYDHIGIVQRLWRGEAILRQNGSGREVPVKIFPRPVQRTLPLWITTSGNRDSFVRIGAQGANLLTHLLGQDIEALARKISQYREARRASGFDAHSGVVSLMVHTFVGEDLPAVREAVRKPLREYLRSAVRLEKQSAASGGSISGGAEASGEAVEPADMEDLLDAAFERYFETGGLLGTPEKCMRLVELLEEAGVNEIACLIDFGVDSDSVMRSLKFVTQVRDTVMRLRVERTRIDVAAFSEALP
jgi:natural product biosynthesis luciferase-like monooxygenase protein